MNFPDPRFFKVKPPLPASDAARIAKGRLVSGEGAITAAAQSGQGGDGTLIFAEKPSAPLPQKAAVLIAYEGAAETLGERPFAIIETAKPKLGFARVAAHLFESRHETELEAGAAEIASSAVLTDGVKVGKGATIDEGAFIGPNSVIGPGVRIGKGTVIGANVSIVHADLGDGCRIASGVRIGEAGFGYTPGEAGPVAVPQLGAVRIGDRVELGANTTVDRGALSDTVIGDDTKIDNLCQIGHNCRIGRGVLIASLTGISGSCTIGDYVMIGGQVGMAEHLTVGSGAVIAAQAGLMRDLEAGARVGGSPARPMRQWMKEIAVLTRLAGGKK
jgi:UDP-3-O-[3-hydroxymyristoyl] glucosamine N-acyltransferase